MNRAVKLMAMLALTMNLLATVGCGNNAGGKCTKDSDCGNGFICQPIRGRDSDYCCPTPPENTSEANCQPVRR